jgi:hypothetical protein
VWKRRGWLADPRHDWMADREAERSLLCRIVDGPIIRLVALMDGEQLGSATCHEP